MGKIYSNQPFKIELSYDTLPATPASVQIEYKNSYGTTGTFTASIDTVNKKIYYYSTVNETLGYSGIYTFWSNIITSTNQHYPGEPIKIQIYEEGE